jgi:murein DD-endopeptidase MepM/ murein hydrolase activator NlpD
MKKILSAGLMGLALILSACGGQPPAAKEPITPRPSVTGIQLKSTALPATDGPAPTPFDTPTPDPTRVVDDAGTELYIVQDGDTLSGIAAEFGTTPEEIAQTNGLTTLSMLHRDDPLNVPLKIDRVGPSAKLIPDSELVYSPGTIDFDIAAFIDRTNGYLKTYTETVDGEVMTGAQVIQRAAEQFSVNPRLLLALLEYRSGWLTNKTPNADQRAYPLGFRNAGYQGLYLQLGRTANRLNDGYYGWKSRGARTVRFQDYSRARIASGLNAGTVGLQTMLAADRTYDQWLKEVAPDGFMKTYRQWFGEPQQYAASILPADLQQPPFTLPWAKGETWYFSGGPHGGWASGSGWAAIDFVPDAVDVGCQPSDRWVTAIADGTVIRSQNGEVVVDLDNDGHEQTGWTILYMHIAADGRVAEGTRIKTGDHIGHASCEGGAANATHVHLARRYNGEWIPAGGTIPFVMDGWQVSGEATEYDGRLAKGNEVKVACECWEEKNSVTK